MQTFLPYANFRDSAQVLDPRRLGKQRVECLQIVRSLRGLSPGWQHHPAVQMWRGYEGALVLYGITICQEWQRRGYRDTCLESLLALADPMSSLPAWIGNPAFHAAHRAALLFKDFEWYSQFGWNEIPAIQYMWPG